MNSTIYELSTVPSTHPSSLFPQNSKCKSIKQFTQIHAQFTKTGLILDPLASAEMLKFLSVSNHRDLNYARRFFAQMRGPNCFSWNTIIRAFADTDSDMNSLEALLLFNQMCVDGVVEPNRFTFPSVLKACAKTGRVEEGKQIHGFVIKLGLDCDDFVLSNLVRMYVMRGIIEDADKLFRNHGYGSNNVVLWNVMIDGYVRLGDIISCRQLFDKMPQRSVVSWNAMISGYAQNGYFKEAIESFRDMLMREESPNYVTLVSVLPAISRLGAVELGKWVHLYAERNEIEIDDVLGSALIDMYSKCGSIEKAIQIFELIRNKTNPITWNAIVSGLAMHGRAKEALDYYERMQKARVKPTDVLYIALLGACSHTGLVKKGRSLFNHMVEVSGLEPRVEHYGCMVDLLGRAGHLDEAEHLILNMPIPPDDVIWKALLGACKMHGNIEMGERVATILMELFPNDSGSYVALSNMFASRQNWDGVANVRMKMKEMDVRKDPGCSWIETNGMIHEFLVEDDSHPKAKEIRSMLEEISEQLRLIGYKPKTREVLLKMEDEEEKESILHYHSEKIAIAFGLISTNPKTQLLIVKNLRICEDCHFSIKLISKIYNRKIVVRDRKRFHHFETGVCSCMDFW
ncbi:Pentatricopeptide repeat (PPR) superfamily protein [Euphorbia peplus]|nr:Pentatricopeptide repeat (PPR) superfamily protein [Euphorbia peplus]